MFIAMNRFRVTKGCEASFEQVWLSRDTHLDEVPGFVVFHLLKGPEAEDHTLYASHTVWENRAVFEAWTKSETFRAAHSRAGIFEKPARNTNVAPHESLAEVTQCAATFGRPELEWVSEYLGDLPVCSRVGGAVLGTRAPADHYPRSS